MAYENIAEYRMPHVLGLISDAYFLTLIFTFNLMSGKCQVQKSNCKTLNLLAQHAWIVFTKDYWVKLCRTFGNDSESFVDHSLFSSCMCFSATHIDFGELNYW